AGPPGRPLVLPGLEPPPDVGDLVVVPPSRPRLEAGPLDGEPVVREPVLGEQRQVVGVAGAEPVAVARGGHPPLGLPAGPVRPRGRPLALGGRGRGAPPRSAGFAVVAVLGAHTDEHVAFSPPDRVPLHPIPRPERRRASHASPVPWRGWPPPVSGTAAGTAPRSASTSTPTRSSSRSPTTCSTTATSTRRCAG